MRRLIVVYVMAHDCSPEGENLCIVFSYKSSRRLARVRAKQIAREMTQGRIYVGTYQTKETQYVMSDDRFEVIR